MPSLVAIDIETTGLDPHRDAIIEIGAVRFSDSRVDAEWSTLINPNKPIPGMITQLTGITNEMVRNAPTIKTVGHQLDEFAGDLPVVGHNVRFDTGFLQNQHHLMTNPIVDTYDIAAVLMPSASRYNLLALCSQLSIVLEGGAHRALNDARATQKVYSRLLELGIQLPVDLLAEIVRKGEGLDWAGFLAFQQMLKARIRQPVKPKSGIPIGQFEPLDPRLHPPLKPHEENLPLDADEMAALLDHGGRFSHYFAGYERRPQQIEMLQAVSNALSKSQHLMVEAGTGTGKSFAYLLPAAHWALKNEQRVVISTNTINLQEQLINKDIPDLRQALELDLRACVLKGRSNYLCPRRFEAFRDRKMENAEEVRVFGKVMVWLHEGGQGDRSEINLNGPNEREVWLRLSAEDEGCKAEACLSRTGGACPFYRSRLQAQSAHLIIVNHALLLADIATGSRVLPDYQYLVIDEAHHMESATTNALSVRVTQLDLLRLIRETGGTSSGVLGRVLTSLQPVCRPSDLAAFAALASNATDLLFRLNDELKVFFKSINDFMIDERDGEPIGSYGQTVRILPATRKQPKWSEVEIDWDAAEGTFKVLLTALAKGIEMLPDLAGEMTDDLEDHMGALATITRRLAEINENLHAAIIGPPEQLIYWIEASQNNALSINIAPLHIGPLMEKHLWYEKEAVILTSATLTAEGSFDYLRERLAATDASELALGSPFDFENAALLYLVNDIPEPTDQRNYQHAVEQAILSVSKATGGRMLALFTSYAQLKRTSAAILPKLTEAGIYVFEQGEGASPHALLESFREADKAVLLGTRSFWEGVDVPGDALSVLMIVKLPFDVPNDPIIASRAETFEDPFNQFSLPEAILRFRQGFGRLIRTQSDRGVVIVLDRRLLSKRYGRMFIDSLPDCTRVAGPLAEAAKRTASWLNL